LKAGTKEKKTHSCSSNKGGKAKKRLKSGVQKPRTKKKKFTKSKPSGRKASNHVKKIEVNLVFMGGEEGASSGNVRKLMVGQITSESRKKAQKIVRTQRKTNKKKVHQDKIRKVKAIYRPNFPSKKPSKPSAQKLGGDKKGLPDRNLGRFRETSFFECRGENMGGKRTRNKRRKQVRERSPISGGI